MKVTTIGSTALMFAFAANLSLAPAASQKKNPDRNADFGDERIPTSWSLVLGNKTIGLADALHYAQGQTIVPSL